MPALDGAELLNSLEEAIDLAAHPEAEDGPDKLHSEVIPVVELPGGERLPVTLVHFDEAKQEVVMTCRASKRPNGGRS